MSIFFRIKGLKLTRKTALFLSILFIPLSVSFISSCAVFLSQPGLPADSIPLLTEEIFTPSILRKSVAEAEAASGVKIETSEALSIIQRYFSESGVKFLTAYSEESDFQEALKKISVIKAAEKCGNIITRRIMVNTPQERGMTEGSFCVILSSVKHLLIQAARDTLPLADMTELLIEEKKFEAETEYYSSPEIFFDITGLEAEISYLRKVRKELINKAGTISSRLEEYKNRRPETETAEMKSL